MMQFPPVRYDAFRLDGGLDLVTPTLALKPGVARDALNFEISVTGGYTRIPGYERFDGRPAPSAASYGVIALTAVAGVSIGDTIVNAAATASGVVIAITTNNIVFTKAVGVFALGDTIKVGVTVIGVTVLPTTFAPTAIEQAQYTAAAANVYRADILVVPGSGPVRGVVYYNGVVYAWRNNAGNTAMEIYKSSAAGWVLVPLGSEIAFNTGADTPWAEGSIVYGNTSGATATVRRVVLSSGPTWVGGSGRLIVTPIAGVFVNGELLKLTNGAGVTKATAASAATPIVLAPNGRVQTVLGTFGSNVATRIYGSDNVNHGFEFDGTTYVPIVTGMVVDTPTNVALHKNFLFFSFGASLQNSGIGTPYIWSPVFGANELIMPEVISALLTMPGTVSSGSLAIFTSANTFMLYGTGVSTWNLVPYNTGIGCNSYTAQALENAYALDDRGIISMQTTLNFGNFDSATLTLAIRPFIQARRKFSTASGLNREKSQFRVFYSDGYGLYTTIVNGRVRGSMPVLYPDPVFCWTDGTQNNSGETSFYGGNLGYVYTLDVGTSFDGAKIGAFFTLNFDPQGSVRVLKRYRRASIEMTGTGYADFAFGYSLAYASTDIDQPGFTSYSSPFAPAYWDQFTWDFFVWDGRALAPSETECIGTGENIAVTINTDSAINQSFTVNSIILHYTPRRGIR